MRYFSPSRECGEPGKIPLVEIKLNDQILTCVMLDTGAAISLIVADMLDTMV